MAGTTDTIPAKLTPGEFVIKREAVDMIGVPFLNKLNNVPDEGGGHKAIDELIALASMEDMKKMYGGGMVKPSMKPMAGGGMMESYRGGGMVMDQYGHGGMVKDKMTMMEKGGQLKPVPEDNPGLGKLPEMVRNRMGYMQMGGMVDNSLMGMTGYKRGGYVSEKERRSPMGMKFKRYENGGEVDPLGIDKRQQMGAKAYPGGVGPVNDDPLG